MNENIKGKGGKVRKLFKCTFIAGALLLLVVVLLGLALLAGSFFWGLAREARGIKLTKACPPTQTHPVSTVPISTRPAQSKQQPQASKPLPPLVPEKVVPACPPPVPACPPVQVFIQQQQQQGGVGTQSQQQQGGGNQQNQKQEDVVPGSSQPKSEYDASGAKPDRWRGPDYIYGDQGRCHPTQRSGECGGRPPSRMGNWDVDVGVYGGQVGGNVHWDNRGDSRDCGGYGGGNNYYLPNSYFGRQQGGFFNRNWRMGSSNGQPPSYPSWQTENYSGQPPVYPDWHMP